ncbi:MAG: PBP1A family penicillin-binding protein [Alphaproteobacteria bacterium]
MAFRRGRRPFLAFLATFLLFGGIAAAVVAIPAWRRLADVVDRKFNGRRWDFPSRILSDEFLVHVGQDVVAAGVPRRLERLGYRIVPGAPAAAGEMRPGRDSLEVALRPGAQGRTTTRHVRIALVHGVVSSIEDLDAGEQVAAVALEPEEITGIYRGDWEKRRAIRVVDVPPILVRSILVTEDSRFFDHHGIDVPGIGRALVTNLRSGRVRQGGSTLTQQLMKNFFLTSDRTVSRKLREVAMAVVAETRYSKMQILENYLNEIYLGQRGAQGIYGVAEASWFYFGKDPKELSLPEAATIAGLIRAPNAYSPFTAPGRARERRDTVLRLLRDSGEIDQATFEAAVATPLVVLEPRPEATDSSWFVDLVKAELAGRFPPHVLVAEGLQIHTTLDPLLQEQASKAVSSGLGALEKAHPALAKAGGDRRLEAALVAIAPHTGEVRALVGGRDYRSSQFDRATKARRQPGSAFKPVVYLAGLLSSGPAHLTPATMLEDAPFAWTEDGGRTWRPENDGGRYLGSVTARTALEQSLNAATARVARGVGLPAIASLGHTMGISSDLPPHPSLSLGAVEVTPLELTSVYAVLASGGTRAEPRTIRRVESRTGEVLVGETPEMTAAVPPEDAYVLTHMLEGVLDRGTARSARAMGFERPAAGKTGTTNDTRDAWFVGYTPDLVAGVWVGFDQDGKVGLPGSKAALPIWVDFMSKALAPLPPRPFPAPPGVTMLAVDRRTGLPLGESLGDPSLASDRVLVEAFRETDAPVVAAPALPADDGSGAGEQPSEGWGT